MMICSCSVYIPQLFPVFSGFTHLPVGKCPPQPRLKWWLTLSTPLFSFFPLSSCLTLSLCLSSLSQSLSSLEHFGPLLLSLSLTPTQLCHTLIPALSGHHLHYRGSSLHLRFVKWTHSPQSPFPPRRVPRWQHSAFPG